MKIRNFTTVSRIDRRLYSIGDTVLPFAVPFRGLAYFFLIGVPTWIVLGIAGVELSADTLVYHLSPPVIGAAFLFTLRWQGKSLGAVVTAHLSYAWWWLRNVPGHRPRTVQLAVVLWRPEHPAYAAAAASAADGNELAASRLVS